MKKVISPFLFVFAFVSFIVSLRTAESNTNVIQPTGGLV